MSRSSANRLCVSLVATLVAGAPAVAQGATVEKPGARRGQAGGTLTHATGTKRHARGFPFKVTPGSEAELERQFQAPEAPVALAWEPFVGMDGQIFPSFVVSTATLRLPAEDDEEEDPRQLGEGFGFLGAAFEGIKAGSRLKLEIKPNAIMEASTLEATAADGGGEYQLFPHVQYRFETLLDWRQPMPLNLTMEAFVDGRSLGVRSQTVTVRSINDCPIAVMAEEDSDEEDLDLSWMFAAYVNEDHPWVDTLTREALQTRVVDGFTGYQSGESVEVLRQVFAVWSALHKRGVRYSDISTTSAGSAVVASQHVRLFDETVTAQQANCVDGTVAIAAILRKIGIEPYLVTLPGHMFLAFDLDAEGEQTVGLETTMIGDADVESPRRNGVVPRELADRFRGDTAFRSFAAALAQGTDALAENQARFEGDDADYQQISLDAARQLGILPLAFRKK